jgi:hypothetical protein
MNEPKNDDDDDRLLELIAVWEEMERVGVNREYTPAGPVRTVRVRRVYL